MVRQFDCSPFYHRSVVGKLLTEWALPYGRSRTLPGMTRFGGAPTAGPKIAGTANPEFRPRCSGMGTVSFKNNTGLQKSRSAEVAESHIFDSGCGPISHHHNTRQAMQNFEKSIGTARNSVFCGVFYIGFSYLCIARRRVRRLEPMERRRPI